MATRRGARQICALWLLLLSGCSRPEKAVEQAASAPSVASPTTTVPAKTRATATVPSVAPPASSGLSKPAAGTGTATASVQRSGATDELAEAQALAVEGRVKEAEAAFVRAVKRKPKSPEAWEGLAAMRFHARRYLEASQAAREASRLAPRSAPARALLASALMEYALQYPGSGEHLNTLREARAEFLKALPDYTERGALLFRLGRVCRTLGDHKGAVKYLTEAHSLLPGRVDVAYSLVRAQMSAGDRAGALASARDATARYPGDPALLDVLGQLLQSDARPDSAGQALEAFAQAASSAPNVAAIQERYGAACLRATRLEEARAAFERAIALRPHRPFAYQQLAVVYSRLGNTERAHLAARAAQDAERDAQQLKRLQRLGAEQADSVPLHLILADRYRSLEMRGAARDEYLLVLQRDPTNQRAKAGLAEVQ